MCLCFEIRFSFKSFDKFAPAVDEGLKGSFECQTVQRSGNARIVLENSAEYGLQEGRLYNDGVDLKLLSAIIAFYITNEQSIASGLGVFSGFFEVVGVFVDPSRLASIVGLGLVEVFHVGDHSWFGI